MQAVVIAGGLGTRMWEICAGKPKVCVPVKGKPFLHHLLNALTFADIDEVFLGLGHGAREVWREACVWDYNLSTWERRPVLHYTTEDRPLGSGGALTRLLLKSGFDVGRTFLLIWGDVLPVWDLHKFIDCVLAEGGPTTVTVSNGGDRNNMTIAPVKKDSFLVNKLSREPTHLDNGIYMINRDDYLSMVERIDPSRIMFPGHYDLWDVLIPLLYDPDVPSRLYNIGALRVHDVGHPDRYKALQEELSCGFWQRLKLNMHRRAEERKAVLETGETALAV